MSFRIAKSEFLTNLRNEIFLKIAKYESFLIIKYVSEVSASEDSSGAGKRPLLADFRGSKTRFLKKVQNKKFSDRVGPLNNKIPKLVSASTCKTA